MQACSYFKIDIKMQKKTEGKNDTANIMQFHYLHIVSNSSVLVNDCSFDVTILPNTNGNATIFSKEFFVSFSLAKKNTKRMSSLVALIVA
jgi:hypothetical protein